MSGFPITVTHDETIEWKHSNEAGIDMSESSQLASTTIPVRASTRTALLIGEDHAVKAALAAILTPEGWRLEECAGLAEALRLAQSRSFELVITSRTTSGKEDVGFLRQIRRVRPHTRVIILTEESTPADVIASMKEHAFGYLSKGLSLDTLAETVRAVIDTPCWDDGIEILSATPNLITLAVRCQIVAADRLLQFLQEITDLPEEECRDVGMAFREMLLNAMEYGGKFDPAKYVEVCYARARHMVMARIKDPGDGFTLEEVQHAAIANPPEDPIAHILRRNEAGMRPGGYGVMLAKNLVDELIYGEKGNEVLLVKYLPDIKPAGHSS
jgi:anti-sigma regulatory factor (Ser/Thr protein kinase)/ActR/RegA family two-component response regulator